MYSAWRASRAAWRAARRRFSGSAAPSAASEAAAASSSSSSASAAASASASASASGGGGFKFKLRYIFYAVLPPLLYYRWVDFESHAMAEKHAQEALSTDGPEVRRFEKKAKLRAVDVDGIFAETVRRRDTDGPWVSAETFANVVGEAAGVPSYEALFLLRRAPSDGANRVRLEEVATGLSGVTREILPLTEEEKLAEEANQKLERPKPPLVKVDNVRKLELAWRAHDAGGDGRLDRRALSELLERLARTGHIRQASLVHLQKPMPVSVGPVPMDAMADFYLREHGGDSLSLDEFVELSRRFTQLHIVEFWYLEDATKTPFQRWRSRNWLRAQRFLLEGKPLRIPPVV